MSKKETIIKAAQAGGQILKEYFGKTLNHIEKSNVADLQTEADIESEKAILKILQQELPNFNIYSEESGKIDKNSEYTIIIDPLDGTHNFVTGIPNFSVSIALLKNEEAILGVVHHPILNQTYYAEKGLGAYFNDKKLSVSNTSEGNRLTISFSCGYTIDRAFAGKIIGEMIQKEHKRVLTNWSPAYDYCLLASGKIDSIFSYNVELYDFAAGKIIAMEAGAKIIDLKGNPESKYTNDSFIISNLETTNSYMLDTFHKVSP